MIGHPETDSERYWRQPSATPNPDPLVQVYVTLPTADDPWGTVEHVRLSESAGRIRVGQELDR
ncbi:hypothetical protein SEA_HOLLIDAY_72 [Gordonia phage Holliday]|nr:hypothetical protein SEA_HOLLIDAY_72 [Gordonia phage Holliday]